MATWKDQQMKMQAKLEAIRKQIEELRIQEKLLVELLGDNAPKAPKIRLRSPAIQPLVLDYMASAGPFGASSKEVDAFVREKVPTVAQDTVGSVLSRLKAADALVYDGERYYEKKHAPAPSDGGLRVVS